VRDALCPLKSYQLLQKTQLPQLECATLCVTMNDGRIGLINCAVSVWQVDERAVGRPSEMQSTNCERPSVCERYCIATTDLLSLEFGTKSQREVPIVLESPTISIKYTV